MRSGAPRAPTMATGRRVGSLVSIMGLCYVASMGRAAFAIAKGAKMPDVTLDKGFPPNKIKLSEIIGGKKVVMVGLPGAFTPT